jgi:hypothetical protein
MDKRIGQFEKTHCRWLFIIFLLLWPAEMQAQDDHLNPASVLASPSAIRCLADKVWRIPVACCGVSEHNKKYIQRIDDSSQLAAKRVNDPLFLIGCRYHRGFIIRHTKKLKEDITQSYPWSIEAGATWHLRKKDVWNYCYCYPRTGFTLNYTNFELPDVLGSAYSLYPFIEPCIRIQKPLFFSIRFGMGPAYMTKVWDEETNPDNLCFSARVSFFLTANFMMNYRFTDHFSLLFAVNYNHISNSGYKLPNLGINFPSISAGFDYSFNKAVFEEREKDPGIVLNPKKNRFDILYGISIKPTTSNDPKRYPVNVLGVNYSRVLGRLLAVTAGAEWVNDKAIEAKIIRYNWVDDSENYLDHNRIAALTGIEWLFGRFIFYQQLGCYVYSPLEPKHWLYQRYGLSFRLTDHIYTGISVKASLANADFMDIRMGVCF